MRAQFDPSGWAADKRNYYYRNPLSKLEGQRPGDLQHYNKANHGQSRVYDAYVSGPLIHDKLFFFLAMEKNESQGKSVGNIYDKHSYNYKVQRPKIYAKINWNINDRNILTLTGLQTSRKEWESVYNYDYDTFQTKDFSSLANTTKTQYRMWVANYTSYITNNLTLHANYGETDGDLMSIQPAFPGFDPTLPHVGGLSAQNPRFAPPGGIGNSQTDSTQGIPTHRTHVQSYRLSLDYRIGNHDLSVGIDNINSFDYDDGYNMTGPGYAWNYAKADPGKPLFGRDPAVPPYVGPPPASSCLTTNGQVNCYYVKKQISMQSASIKVVQRAQYIQDKWQITPNFLLNIGLRNDQFTNYDSFDEPYIRLTKPQWAPRIGFSWDVHGDSTLKIFGNAGRYYLALPLTTATSIAAPVVATNLYGTYTGIDQQTGEPIGFKPLPQSPSTGVSIDNEYGQPKDPRVSTAKNVSAEYSDNFVLGLQQQFQMLGTKWVFSATGTYQHMNRIIDDYDDIQRECAVGREAGYDWMTPKDCYKYAQSLILVNPGETQELYLKAPDGSLVPITFTKEDQGFKRGPTRKYYSLDLSLEHAWDGKWFAKIDYVFSKVWGNTEGPVSTYSQQSGSYESLTTNWDFPERMENSYGVLPNDRRHQIKLFGAYAISPEWTVSGNWYLASGTPRLCRGGYGPNELALHGSHTYYWCGGKPIPPGSIGRLPWTRQLNLKVDYRPAFANHKLDFQLSVFNVLNQQKPLFINDFYLTTNSPNPDYGRINNSQAPRFVRISMAYNF